MPYRFAEPVLDLALVLLGPHVNEVDDDETAQVADSKLPGNFIGCLEVGVERGRLDVAALGGARRVDVDRNERLGVIDDDTAARWQRDRVRESRLDLALDLEPCK